MAFVASGIEHVESAPYSSLVTVLLFLSASAIDLTSPIPPKLEGTLRSAGKDGQNEWRVHS